MENLGIYHDRFGFLTCHLSNFKRHTILTQKSQEKAILENLKSNELAKPVFLDILSPSDLSSDAVVLKIPKSLDLFRLFLDHISRNVNEEATVLCGFMTRRFSKGMIQIAREYFEEVGQSRAVKKARVLKLKGIRKTKSLELIRSLNYKDRMYEQYLGVFSSRHIDLATQFFLDHLQIEGKEESVLDLASGNGILGAEISRLLPMAEIHLLDDSKLCVASGVLNLDGEHIHHHWKDNLDGFEDESFDLIVTNPPFHFEYENNIHTSLTLFKQAFRCLKPRANLQIVANRHLNYKVHLVSLFSRVDIVAKNDKYHIYKCVK